MKSIETKKKLVPNKVRSRLARLVIKRETDWALRNITEQEQLDKFV